MLNSLNSRFCSRATCEPAWRSGLPQSSHSPARTTRNGVRLEIVSPKLGRGIRLCPLELEALTWQTHETFSEFLRTPFGPENDPE